MDTRELVIIGTGPAGLTAAIYARRAGLDALLIEKGAVGGQILITDEVENWPGVARASGQELVDSIYQHAMGFEPELLRADVTGIVGQGPYWGVVTTEGEIMAKTVLIASGASFRRLGCPGEARLTGMGVSYCAVCDGAFFEGEEVAVIGGGNTAVADVIYLARICRKVYLVHRRDKLRATAIYHQRLAELDNVELCWDSVATEFLTENDERPRVSGLRIRNQKTDGVRDLAVSAVFIAVGTTPNTEFLGGALALDAGGYIIADGTGRTATADVFAAGDVRTKELRQVVTAVADGANCAESAADFLNA